MRERAARHLLVVAVASIAIAAPFIACQAHQASQATPASSPRGSADTAALRETYCATPVDEEVIRTHYFSHFGVLHDDPAWYPDQVALGAPWERTVALTFDLNEIADGRRWTNSASLFAALDPYVMHAQLEGIWLQVELYLFRPFGDTRRVEEALTAVAERYDHDGTADMPCLKYPVKHFGVGNEIAGTFKGEPQDFLDVLETTRHALRGANPDAVIVQAGLVPGIKGNPDVHLWDTLLGLGADEYVDVVVYHELQGREDLSNLMFFPTYFAAAGLERPLWINELQLEYTGRGPTLTPEQYSPVFIRYLTYAIAHGTEKLFFANFKFPPPHAPADMPPPFTEASALVDSGGLRTVLFDAVATFIARFDRFTDVAIVRETMDRGETVREIEGQYRFTVDGKSRYVLWGQGPLPAEIRGSVMVTDVFGHESTVDAGEVELTDEPIYVEAP